ncbi:hypothetical protein JMUB3870_0206 [Leptotrichia trevisanii]|uniref:Uncharacterized protein n=1 Tax=Leptotrichia trevisanii TaxID=109328 RepID=A0A510JYN4_9FUSO|nr:hypothetical protein JMUB3870_0206 [Leptotrichia trevisanii]
MIVWEFYHYRYPPLKNTINILLIQLGWIFCRRHLYIYLTKEKEKRLTPLLKLSNISVNT